MQPLKNTWNSTAPMQFGVFVDVTEVENLDVPNDRKIEP